MHAHVHVRSASGSQQLKATLPHFYPSTSVQSAQCWNDEPVSLVRLVFYATSNAPFPKEARKSKILNLTIKSSYAIRLRRRSRTAKYGLALNLADLHECRLTLQKCTGFHYLKSSIVPQRVSFVGEHPISVISLCSWHLVHGMQALCSSDQYRSVLISSPHEVAPLDTASAAITSITQDKCSTFISDLIWQVLGSSLPMLQSQSSFDYADNKNHNQVQCRFHKFYVDWYELPFI